MASGDDSGRAVEVGERHEGDDGGHGIGNLLPRTFDGVAMQVLTTEPWIWGTKPYFLGSWRLVHPEPLGNPFRQRWPSEYVGDQIDSIRKIFEMHGSCCGLVSMMSIGGIGDDPVAGIEDRGTLIVGE